MQIIRSTPVTETRLTTSNVPIDDYADWSSGATYTTGDRVVYGIEAWESLTDSNTDQPDTGADKEVPSWLRLGYVNRWRMFRDGRESKTRQNGGFAATVTPDVVVNSLALLGMEGLDFTLTVTDPTDGVVYQRTEDIVDTGVGNWWDFYFLPYGVNEDFVFTDLPPYSNAAIEVSVTTSSASDTSAIGRFAIGISRELGITVYGTSVRSLDFSKRERDGFGNLMILERRQIALVDFRVDVPTENVDKVKRELDQLRNQETVFIGSPDFESTIIFGFYRDFDITIANYAISDATLEVEGL